MSKFDRDFYKMLNGKVNVSSQNNGEILVWDNTAMEWQNQELYAAGLLDSTIGQWLTWAPTRGGANSMTITSSSITQAAYRLVKDAAGEKTCEYYGLFSVTVNAAGGSLTLVLPVTTSIPDNTYIGSGQRSTGGWTTRRQLIVMKQSGSMYVEADAGATWAAGTTYLVGVCGSYRVS